MTDPKRLSLACESDFERLLLRAGRASAPAGAKERALLAASAAAAASSLVAAGTAGHAAGAAKLGSLAALKWVGVLSLTGVGMAASAAVVHEIHRNATRGPLPASTTLPVVHETGLAPKALSPASPAALASPEPLETPAPAPKAVAPPTVRSTPKAVESSASTLPAELALLERARAAVSAGQPASALAILDGYAARFPHGDMAPEAAVLRIETLIKSGDRPGAVRFADLFLARHPHSPYAARIQSLLSASDP